MELTDYQKDILIRTALGEARGEGVEGMADVIQVVLNRAKSGKFPSDPAKVALQDKQFSTWNSGEGGNNPQNISANSKIYQTAAQALEAVVGGRPDPTGGALYYHAPSVSPSWSTGVNTNGKIERNGHVFYPSYPVPPGEIPNTVGTALDTRRPTPMPAAMPRAVQVQRDQNAALADRLAVAEPNAAPTAMPVGGDLMTPGAIGSLFANLPSPPASMRPVPVRSASDQVRGNEQQTRNTATTIASYPTVMPPSASDMARGRNGYETIATYPTTGIGQPPATRVVQSVPPPMPSPVRSASDMTRGNEMQTREIAQTIASIPSRSALPQSYAGQERAPASVQMAEAPPAMPSAFGAFSFNPIPDRLEPGFKPYPDLAGDAGTGVFSDPTAKVLSYGPGGMSFIPAPMSMPPMPRAMPQRSFAQAIPLPQQGQRRAPSPMVGLSRPVQRPAAVQQRAPLQIAAAPQQQEQGRGQAIMTDNSGIQVVGQRVNNSARGYTVDRNPIFNASRGI